MHGGKALDGRLLRVNLVDHRAAHDSNAEADDDLAVFMRQEEEEALSAAIERAVDAELEARGARTASQKKK